MSVMWSIYAPDVQLQRLEAAAGPDVYASVQALREPSRAWMREDFGLTVDEVLLVSDIGDEYVRDLASLFAMALLERGDVLILANGAPLIRRTDGRLSYVDHESYWKPRVYAAMDRLGAPAG